MIFIETSLFTKLLPSYLGDDDYRGLQNYLLQHPESGDVVRGSGGVRKVRWAADGQGKSGGVRVIYYWKKSDDEVWMLTIYGKSDKATIPGHQLKKIAEAINNDKS
ncbi:type II toxin-antitoxin system RelE/ParE family toxin [Alteromonas sp. B31-7]|uniref:type II toxin-antitoxin system RelE/ParE family toxin n=1 Tax=Alteromonas sp. B31-7 TaxID=2785913 RepID=UPI0018CADC5C|nr:type II toxin-antitoxin system RelE/ParE family toxin [Alteromonas sp. B31-7]QPL48726.1 type II toxin-antitoxin system RelE/ParE family toxin [Alteromonas sp. B31-7]|tara:strand:- start:431 stop:748 length:318 start_codon:yes stop_codon:yes gene_type:complete